MAYSPYHLISDKVRKKTVPWLEFFHPYKHACEVLWKHQALFYGFLAPLYHHLHPKSTVPVKPKLKILECTFTLLRLVYPSVREHLATGIQRAYSKNRNALGNVQLLFDFFLPVVCFVLKPNLLLDNGLWLGSANWPCF